MTEGTEEISKGLVEGIIEALSNKHSQMDLRLQGLTLSIGDSRFAMKLSGTVSVAIHMREMSDAERDAHASATVAKLQS